MAENATNEEKNGTVTETEQGTPLVESEEVARLETEKVRLEEEIKGIEGTRKSILDDVARARQERKEARGETDSVDIETIKKELSEELSNKLTAQLAEQNTKFLKQQADLQTELIKAKKTTLDSINARMASVSGSNGQASSDSIVENEVELSNDEREVMKQVGLTNPRYLKDVEVRGN